MDPEEVAIQCREMDGWENNDDEEIGPASELESKMLVALVPHGTQELTLEQEEKESWEKMVQQEERVEYPHTGREVSGSGLCGNGQVGGSREKSEDDVMKEKSLQCVGWQRQGGLTSARDAGENREIWGEDVQYRRTCFSGKIRAWERSSWR